MDEHEPRGETLTSAESAFIEFLSRSGTKAEAEFEEFCADHKEIADELRVLYREWAHLDRLLSDEVDSDDLNRRIERHFGTSFGQGVSLHGPSTGGETAAEIVRRLTEHSPRVWRYSPRGKIASGGMGAILKVWDQDLRRNLAMKVVLVRKQSTRRDGERELRTLGRFLEEAQITAQLGHPGILPVHELGLDGEGRVYFTMPLVKGRELKEIIQLARAGKEGWDQRRALGVMLKVCDAVAYAHSMGVIHRDLKPSNVMVGRFGETYVMDWGLARVLGRPDAHDIRLKQDLEPVTTEITTDRSAAKDSTPGSPLVTHDGDVLGTPAFMSPEQARGLVEGLGPASDIYSLGAMLYQLLTGTMPYARSGHTSTPHVVLQRLLKGPPEPVRSVAPEVPAEAAAVCDKAMARDPEDRYASALDLAHDLEAYLGLRPVAAREASLAYVGRLFVQRNRAAVLATLAATLLLALWGGIYLSERRAERAARQRLVDVGAAHWLLAEADSLYPVAPATLPRIEQWTAGAEDLLSRVGEYRHEPAEAEGHAGLIADVDRLEALLPTIQARASNARELPTRTIGQHAMEWSRAIESIRASPKYGTLELRPQLGLVPLQHNPQSGLWEFWLEPSGSAPVIADPRTGALELGADSGVVLVLVPGGVFTMGPGDDELATGNYHPSDRQHEVRLQPFFMSKYETTQAQYQRLMGVNPARYRPGYSERPVAPTPQPGDMYTEINPVESVTFFESRDYAERVGCRLPTEEQWEYACRAWTKAPFSWGFDTESLKGNENLADQSQAGMGSVVARDAVPWNDGYVEHAPVGTFRPNPFGLYDMHGNVSEWCDTKFVYDEGAGPHPDLRIFRGGSWYVPAAFATSSFRQWDTPRGANQTRGFRIARSINR